MGCPDSSTHSSRCHFQIIIFEVLHSQFSSRQKGNRPAQSREFSVSPINNRITIKQVIFVRLVAMRLTRSVQIIQLLLIPINNAITIAIRRRPPQRHPGNSPAPQIFCWRCGGWECCPGWCWGSLVLFSYLIKQPAAGTSVLPVSRSDYRTIPHLF